LELTEKDVQKSIKKHTNKKTSIEQPFKLPIEPTNEPFINDSKLSSKQNKLIKQEESKLRFTPPSLKEVLDFFKEQEFVMQEAEPFFLYYQANGWMVGRAKMKNWQAAAKNWILRSKKFQAEKTIKLVPNQLNAKNTNYEERL
jgi:hypothetical protein